MGLPIIDPARGGVAPAAAAGQFQHQPLPRRHDLQPLAGQRGTRRQSHRPHGAGLTANSTFGGVVAAFEHGEHRDRLVLGQCRDLDDLPVPASVVGDS